MGKTKKILCIDGGGIRGIIPATILSEIERKTGKPISENFDLIAGTSTGGIIALALCVPDKNKQPKFSAEDLIGFYENSGPKIFSPRLQSRIPIFGGLFRSKYSQTNINQVLNTYFENTSLSEALTDLIIPSYDIEQENPIYFTTNFAKYRYGFDHPMKEVARATSAAPTYFPPSKRCGKQKTLFLIDGGIFGNNPSMIAYAEAKRLWPEVKDEDFLFVSLGTGQHSKEITYKRSVKWGVLQWAWKSRVINVVLDSVTKSADTQILYTLPTLNGKRRYFRFQTSLDIKNTQMDNGSKKNIDDLKEIAEKLIKIESDSLNQLYDLL